MYALYTKNENWGSYYFDGYVFREKTYVLRPDIDEDKKGFVETFIKKPIKIIGCFLLDKFKKVYKLEIKHINYKIPKNKSGRQIKRALENHIRELFVEEYYELGFFHVRALPQNYITHKQIKKLSKQDAVLKRIVEKYRKKGFDIPEHISLDGCVCKRKEKGSLSDLIQDPVY